jgi:pentatricopeptide repeat protein
MLRQLQRTVPRWTLRSSFPPISVKNHFQRGISTDKSLKMDKLTQNTQKSEWNTQYLPSETLKEASWNIAALNQSNNQVDINEHSHKNVSLKEMLKKWNKTPRGKEMELAWTLFVNQSTLHGSTTHKLTNDELDVLRDAIRGRYVHFVDYDSNNIFLADKDRKKMFNRMIGAEARGARQKIQALARVYDGDAPPTYKSAVFMCQSPLDYNSEAFSAILEKWRLNIRALPMAEREEEFSNIYLDIFTWYSWVGYGQDAMKTLEIAKRDFTLKPIHMQRAMRALCLDNRSLALEKLTSLIMNDANAKKDDFTEELLPEFVKLLYERDEAAATQIILDLVDARKLHPTTLAAYVYASLRNSERGIHESSYQAGDSFYMYNRKRIHATVGLFQDILKRMETEHVVKQVTGLTSSTTPLQRMGHEAVAVYLECLFVLGQTEDAFATFCSYLGTAETQPRLSLSASVRPAWDVTIGGMCASAKRNDTARADRLFHEMLHNDDPDLHPGIYHVTALMASWAKVHDVDKTWQLYQNMKMMGFTPTATHLGILIRSTARTTNPILIEEMFCVGTRELGLVVNPGPKGEWTSTESALVGTAIDAAGFTGDEKLVWKVWWWPRPVGFPSDAPKFIKQRSENTFTSLIEALCRINSHESRITAIDYMTRYMPSWGIQPGYKAWSTLLRFLTINRQTEQLRSLAPILMRGDHETLVKQLVKGWSISTDRKGLFAPTLNMLRYIQNKDKLGLNGPSNNNSATHSRISAKR